MNNSNINCLLVTGVNPGSTIQVPVGLIYLGTQLKKHGYCVEIIQVTNKQIFDVCKNKISNNKYVFVGFSVWMGPTSMDMLHLTRHAKECGQTTIWGGKFVTSLKEEVLSEKSIDICAVGDAEETVVELANAIRSGSSLSEVAGIYYRDTAGAIIASRSRIYNIENLDEYDFDLSLIQDWKPYIIKDKKGNLILDPFESQRGCLFRCRFCFHSDDTIYSDNKKKRIRSHSVTFILKKAEELKKLTGVGQLTFCDDEFWIDEERSLSIIKGLKDLGITICFIRIRFSSINDYMLRELSTLGVTAIACGLESGNARILKLMNKGITLEKVKEKASLLAKYPIIVNTVIILGNPTETKEEMLESIRFTLGLRKIIKDLNLLTFFYRPLPATDFGKMAEEIGFQRPHTIEGWVSVSSGYSIEIGHQWLPWFDKREQRQMRRNEDYFIMSSALVSKLCHPRQQRLLVRIIIPLLYILERASFWRIYYWNFDFPIDLGIFKLIQKLGKLMKIVRPEFTVEPVNENKTPLAPQKLRQNNGHEK